MTILTKFWRTKAATVVTSVVAMMLVWGALAWPDWTSTKAAPYDANRQAWQWMASLTPEQRATLIAVTNGQASTAAPPPQPVAAAAPPPVIVQHVTVVRHVPAGSAAVASAPDQAPAASAPPPQQAVTAPAPSVPRSSAPAPVAAPAPPPAPAPAPPPPPPPITTTKAS